MTRVGLQRVFRGVDLVSLALSISDIHLQKTVIVTGIFPTADVHM